MGRHYASLGALLVFVFASVSCGLEEQTAQLEFMTEPTTGTVNPTPTPSNTVRSHFYAKYRFSSSGYYDVDVALKLGVSDYGTVETMQTKDLTPGRKHIPTEALAITENVLGSYRYSSKEERCGVDGNPNICETVDPYTGHIPVDIGATSTLNVDGVDYGGAYKGHYAVPCSPATLTCMGQGGIRVTDEWLCCDKMSFVPTANSAVTFTGAKLTTEKALDEAWWQRVTGQCDYKLVFTGMPEEVTVGTRFNFKVKLKDCGNSRVTNGAYSDAEVSLYERFEEEGQFRLVNMIGEKAVRTHSRVDMEHGVANFRRVIRKAQYNSISTYDQLQFKATATIDEKEYSATSDKISILPKE